MMKNPIFKKVFLIAALFIISFGNEIHAKKPMYCEEAYLDCLATCASIYNEPIQQAACNAGCLIGYANCGGTAN